MAMMKFMNTAIALSANNKYFPSIFVKGSLNENTELIF
jgi:hypothetical protein